VAGAEVITTEMGVSWGKHLRLAIERVDLEIVLLMMPDYFLEAKVDSARISECVALITGGRTGYVRLAPDPTPRRSSVCRYGGSEFVLLGRREGYSTSLAASLWRSSVLQELLRDDDSPWRFERQGPGRRCGGYEHYTVRERQLVYSPTGALIRGRWTRAAVKRLVSDRAPVEFTGRPTMSRGAWLIQVAKATVFNATYPIVGRAVEVLRNLQVGHGR
jgi:hypothetical protein